MRQVSSLKEDQLELTSACLSSFRLMKPLRSVSTLWNHWYASGLTPGGMLPTQRQKNKCGNETEKERNAFWLTLKIPMAFQAVSTAVHLFFTNPSQPPSMIYSLYYFPSSYFLPVIISLNLSGFSGVVNKCGGKKKEKRKKYSWKWSDYRTPMPNNHLFIRRWRNALRLSDSWNCAESVKKKIDHKK